MRGIWIMTSFRPRATPQLAMDFRFSPEEPSDQYRLSFACERKYESAAPVWPAIIPHGADNCGEPTLCAAWRSVLILLHHDFQQSIHFKLGENSRILA
jgi:hypothetical protein